MDKILLLFDIDGTLINSCYKNNEKKSHGHYICKAMAQVFLGDAEKVDQISLEGIHMPGGTDGSICLDVLAHNNLITAEEKQNPPEDLVSKIDYCCNIISPKMLSCDIRAGEFVTKMCPNVNNLLEKLAQDQRFVVGLLTGNYAVCAKLKLESAGVDVSKFMEQPEVFLKSSEMKERKNNFELEYDVDPRNDSEISFIGSFGSDNFIRRKLPPIAVQRYEDGLRKKGLVENQQNVSQQIKALIIGDTPKDIDCAQFNGLKAVGVATGYYTSAQLREVGGDLVLEDFNDTQEFIEKTLKLYGK